MDTPNPYSSPAAAVADRDKPWESEIPEEIVRPIKHGWIAALISTLLTLAATLIFVLKPAEGALFDAWNFLDVGLMAVLTFGIYKRSRTAATIMFAYFLLSKILAMVETGMPNGIVMGLVFLIFYFRAMTATYRYHRFANDWKRNPPAPKRPLSEDPLFATKTPDSAA